MHDHAGVGLGCSAFIIHDATVGNKDLESLMWLGDASHMRDVLKGWQVGIGKRFRRVIAMLMSKGARRARWIAGVQRHDLRVPGAIELAVRPDDRVAIVDSRRTRSQDERINRGE